MSVLRRFHPSFVICFMFFTFSLCNTYSAQPYTVKTVYFLPTDSDDRSEWLDLDDIMKSIQSVYKNEMDRNGFPGKTFRLETDNKGKVVVHKFNARHKKEHYASTTIAIVMQELQNNGFNDKRSIYAVVMAGMKSLHYGFAGGVASARPDGGIFGNSDYYGYALSIEDTTRANVEQLLTHELGHTFGLWHIVLYDPAEFILGSGKKLSLHEARWLSKYHYFNNNWNINFAPVMLKFSGAENFGEDNIRFRMNVIDPNGLHQAYITHNSNVIAWDFLEGNTNETSISMDVKRDFLLDGKQIWIQIMDNSGNWYWHPKSYTLPKSKEDKIVKKPDPINKNPDLSIKDDAKDDVEDDDIQDDDIIVDMDDCIINCKIDGETQDDYEHRSVIGKNKLSIMWGEIKSQR